MSQEPVQGGGQLTAEQIKAATEARIVQEREELARKKAAKEKDAGGDGGSGGAVEVSGADGSASGLGDGATPGGSASSAAGGSGHGAIEITNGFVIDCLRANELGDGMLYAAMHQDRVIYAKNSQQWFVWDEHYWRRDDLDQAVGSVETVACRYAEEIHRLRKEISDAYGLSQEDGKTMAGRNNPLIENLYSRIARLRKDSGRNNCLKFAHTNPKNQLAITGKEFDMNPWLMATPNGVINLKTGELEKGYPSDYISKRTAAPFYGLGVKAAKNIWTETLRQIYDGDEELIAYLQRLFGYGITGLSVEHVFPVMLGRGRNGKSLIIEAISYALGDYCGIVPAELLLESSRQTNAAQSTPELMALKGLRLAIASETDEGRRFSAARVKWLTGGDTITARGLYDRHPTQFDPTHLLILLTNHEPGAPDSDMAFWERCFLIQHRISFVNREPVGDRERRADPSLPMKLRQAGPEIIEWLVNGCLEWQRVGLKPPASVIKSTAEYREESDYIGQFLEACTIKKDGVSEMAGLLYEAFRIWYLKTINENPRYVPSQKAFGKKLRSREDYPPSKSNGLVVYHGLSLNPEYVQKVLNSRQDGDGQ